MLPRGATTIFTMKSRYKMLIRSVAHFNLISFASSLNWTHHYNCMSISTGNIMSFPQTMEDRVSLVVECRMVWYDHNILGSSSSYKLLSSSSFLLSLFRITLLDDSTLQFSQGCRTKKYFICTPKCLQKSLTIVLESWVPSSEIMVPGSSYLHIISHQQKYNNLLVVIFATTSTSINMVK